MNGDHALNAYDKYEDRRSTQRKLIRHPDLCERAIERIKQGWTPEQIGNRMIYEGAGQRVCQDLTQGLRAKLEGIWGSGHLHSPCFPAR